MEIEKLGGTTERLYRLVAPLVMKPCILRENNNYPFKTSMHHIWFIAIEEERVVGFMPVEIKDKYAVIIIDYSIFVFYFYRHKRQICCNQ